MVFLGAPTPKVLLFCNFLAENCMKMKEFGPQGGGARPWFPLRSANGFIFGHINWLRVKFRSSQAIYV